MRVMHPVAFGGAITADILPTLLLFSCSAAKFFFSLLSKEVWAKSERLVPTLELRDELINNVGSQTFSGAVAGAGVGVGRVVTAASGLIAGSRAGLVVDIAGGDGGDTSPPPLVSLSSSDLR